MKRKQKDLFLVFTFIFILIGVAIIFGDFHQNFYSSSPSREEFQNMTFKNSFEFQDVSIKESVIDDYSYSTENHWGHMPITFKFETICHPRVEGYIRMAFENIQNETENYISFNETSSSPDISIYCYQNQGYDDSYKKDLGVTLTEYDKDNKAVLTHAEIFFYGEYRCGTGYPAIEVHEILHALGVDYHSPKKVSVMSEFVAGSSRDCKVDKIDYDIRECLKSIYSHGETTFNCSQIDKIYFSPSYNNF